MENPPLHQSLFTTCAAITKGIQFPGIRWLKLQIHLLQLTSYISSGQAERVRILKVKCNKKRESKVAGTVKFKMTTNMLTFAPTWREKKFTALQEILKRINGSYEKRELRFNYLLVVQSSHWCTIAVVPSSPAPLFVCNEVEMGSPSLVWTID